MRSKALGTVQLGGRRRYLRPHPRSNLVYQRTESSPGIATPTCFFTAPRVYRAILLFNLKCHWPILLWRPITVYTKSKYLHLFVGIRLNTSLLSPQTMLFASFARLFIILTDLKIFFQKTPKIPKITLYIFYHWHIMNTSRRKH